MQSENIKHGSSAQTKEACEELQKLVDGKEKEIAVLDALSKKYKSQLDEQETKIKGLEKGGANAEEFKSMEEEKDNLQNQLTEMRLILAEQENDILAVEGERDDVLTQAASLTDEVVRLQSANRRMEDKMVGLAVPEMRARLEELEGEKIALQGSMADHHVSKEEHLRVVIEKDEDIKRLKIDVREATDKYANIVEALKNDNQKELQRMKSEDSQIIAHIESESTRAMQALEEQLQVCKEEIEELKAVQQAELNHMSEKQQGEMGEYAQVKV